MSLCYLQYYHINVSDGDDEMMIMMITCVSLVVQSSGSSHQCVGPHNLVSHASCCFSTDPKKRETWF